jgi:hypothetical protein
MLDEPTPAEADPDGVWYAFEKGATKTGGGNGWADVWKRGHFAIEFKKRHTDLRAAFAQIQRYAIALENPPLLIVSDMDTIQIHTNFTNTVQEVHVLTLDDLEHADKRRLLKWAFTDPEQLKPGQTREEITREAAGEFANLAQDLRDAGHEPHKVAHFVNRLLFCLFAEDIGLLPPKLFTRAIHTATIKPARFTDIMTGLFRAMQEKDGSFGVDDIDWFNGGLFDNAEVLPLGMKQLRQLERMCRKDWSVIEPSIFGTLFERGLDPDKRSQLGAHYTDQVSIMRIVEPVVVRPLRVEWQAVKDRIGTLLEQSESAKSKAVQTRAYNEAVDEWRGFRARLKAFRVLDPACGSGNFLYLALRELKDLEHLVLLEGEQVLKVSGAFPEVDESAVLGIELNEYATELARVTVWIGQIQWMLGHGYNVGRNPILNRLDQIECRDAVMNADGTEAEWPAADCIVGNPPFLGNKKMIAELGEEYVSRLRTAYEGRVPGGAELVMYWFDKARVQIENGKTARAGLVSTQSIRGGLNRPVVERILEKGSVFEAWSDEPWVVEGAALRVSILCFSGSRTKDAVLDGRRVPQIFSDLSSRSFDRTLAVELKSNKDVSFQGTIKTGKFDITGERARGFLELPNNPHGKSNAEVIRPWANGNDVTKMRPSDTWIVDFGTAATEESAALYEAPFEYLRREVQASRLGKREGKATQKWWLLQRSRPEMRTALEGLARFIGTPRVSEHRVFVWLHPSLLPDSRLVAFAREDDTSFGILHSRAHEVWSLVTSSRHGKGNQPTYNNVSCFETFPFPAGLEPNRPAAEYVDDPRAIAIAEAARRLVELRDNWLNPAEWVKRVPEVVAGYPERVLPVSDEAAEELKKRTLTKLYNERPAWLAQAHAKLDAAVAAAYGWAADIGEDEVLARLFALNQERAKA